MMRLKRLAALLLLLALSRTQIVTSGPSQLYPKFQPCLNFLQGNCIGCPYNYHVNDNQCYLNITSCLSYSLNNLGLEICNMCDPSNSVSDGDGGCSTVSMQLTTSFSAVPNIQSIAQQYGDSRFQIIPLQVAFADPFFNKCNNYMLTGQYTHFINRTSQPVNAVSFFSIGSQNQYKILYYGSGGGLMMSIMTISTSNINSYILNSFVPIGTTNIIDFCGLYDEALQCVACNIGYHLQSNYCYPNIAGCNSYSRNICLQCSGYGVLIQNRCVGCSEMGDLGKVAFFEEVSSYINSNTLPFFSQAYLLL